jgi:hypothetical protein
VPLQDVIAASVKSPTVLVNELFTRMLSNSRGHDDGDGVAEAEGTEAVAVGEGIDDAVTDAVTLPVADAVLEVVGDAESDGVTVGDTECDGEADTVYDGDAVNDEVNDAVRLGESVADAVQDTDCVVDPDTEGDGDTHAPLLTEICALSMPSAATIVSDEMALTISTLADDAEWSISMEILLKKSRPYPAGLFLGFSGAPHADPMDTTSYPELRSKGPNVEPSITMENVSPDCQ